MKKPMLVSGFALLAALLVGCAAATEDVSDESGAVTTGAGDITSLTGGTWTDFRVDFLPDVLSAKGPSVEAVGITKTDKGALVIGSAYLLPVATDRYTLTIGNSSEEHFPDDVPDLPRKIVRGAVARLMLATLDAQGRLSKIIVADDSPDKVSAFAKITIEGDVAHYDTVTTAGRHAVGTIPLPGLSTGKGKYGVVGVPRNLPTNGSILGTHFFAITAACDAGAASCVIDPIFDGPEPPPRNGTSCYSETLQDSANELACVSSSADGVWEQCHQGKWYRGGDEHTGPYGACASK